MQWESSMEDDMEIGSCKYVGRSRGSWKGDGTGNAK